MIAKAQNAIALFFFLLQKRVKYQLVQGIAFEESEGMQPKWSFLTTSIYYQLLQADEEAVNLKENI